jgi:hypothetical protein
MRWSVAAVVLGALCALLGGWLVAKWALGLVLIAEGALAVWWGVFVHDDGQPAARAPGTALEQVFDRARAS